VLCFVFQIVKEISTHEASIIMLMTSTLLEYSYDMLREFSMIQERTTKRAVSLATLYQTTYTYVRWFANDVCGLSIKFKTASYIFDCSFFRFSFFSFIFKLRKASSEFFRERCSQPIGFWIKICLIYFPELVLQRLFFPLANEVWRFQSSP